MFNRRLLISEAGVYSNLIAGLTVGVNGGFYGYSDGTQGGTYGKIEPNPITISGKTGQIKCLYMTGRTMITMYIMWNGSGFPTDLRVDLGSYGDVIMPYVDFFDEMAVYEFSGDPDVTEMLFNSFKTNVDYTIPCTISNANIDLPIEPPIEI